MIRRVAMWTGLVTACALPLLITVRNDIGRADSGLAIGVLVWIVTMLRIDVLRRQRQQGSGSLAVTAAGYAVVQAAAALTLPSHSIFLLYGPSAAVMGWLVLRHLGPFDAVSAFVLTWACGLQVLASLLLLERLVQRFQGHRPDSCRRGDHVEHIAINDDERQLHGREG